MGASFYHKARKGAPHGFFKSEALGLQWLDERQPSASTSSLCIAQVENYGDDFLDIELIDTCTPTPDAALQFGDDLAYMHLKGAPYYGYSPSPDAYFGPLSDPVPAVNGRYDTFQEYFIFGRMKPILEIGIQRGEFTTQDLEQTLKVLENYFESVKAEAWLNAPPARVHGDLWSGNLLWTCQKNDVCEAVLIDPSAHGGHFEEDLAMLQLFGCPYFMQILQGYQNVHLLDDGFRARFNLHNLYPIAGHVVFFGGSYYSQYMNMLHSI